VIFTEYKNFLRHKKAKHGRCLDALWEETYEEASGSHRFQQGHSINGVNERKRKSPSRDERGVPLQCPSCYGNGCNLCENRVKRRKLRDLLQAISQGTRLEAFELLNGLLPEN
jgi:hypothetical protein